MRTHFALLGSLTLSLVVGCGASDGSGTPASSTKTGTDTANDSFAPPPPPAGYTRITAPVIADIPGGGDVLRCQYVLAPFDRDMDVLDIQGYQSLYGHHSVAYAVSNDVPVGTDRVCNTEDNTTIGTFLGGVGGEAGGAVKLPDGVVFRLPKGDSVMLNTHFLNTGTNTVDGETVLDVKFAEVDPSRTVASMFVNLNVTFTLNPDATTTADATCTVPNDYKFISFTNHMHMYGTDADTELTHADGTVQDLHKDSTWTAEMQFNPIFSQWSLDTPMAVSAGDSIHTHCEWKNTTSKSITFPDEMCVGIGFFVNAPGVAPTSPVCIGGTMLPTSSSAPAL